MKKLILTSLTLLLALVSLSSFAFTRCDTSSSTFCACFMNNFKTTCPRYLPAAKCASMGPSDVKAEINTMGGATTSCNIQSADPDKHECTIATQYFINHC